MERLKALLEKLQGYYPAYFPGETRDREVFFISPEKFENFQIGYRIHGYTGEDLTGTADGDWQPGWYAVGNIPPLGDDPLFTDINDENFPLYTAQPGAGRWDAIKLIDSLYNLTDKIKLPDE